MFLTTCASLQKQFILSNNQSEKEHIGSKQELVT